ncbi:sulfur carrier protein ThiS [Mangrovicoccus algicola]|uniref:Sulfur carrier protein ThiS n=1 Tax=Mangrovicoccus algicola TaxID=2771008 RepID=A0A8J7CW49_9RHOB|nr:sulfur carrier protein ThiS [Mangrovicoccus algicola]MBE3639539.1 sulfur carrier protein ThiS [Mangrovicoccus algicola]
MQIELNGERIETGAASLDALVEERGHDAGSVATALDGAFVPRPLRAAAMLRDGARVEILSPMQGG